MSLSAPPTADGLVTDNLGLVHTCCRRFAGRGMEYDDLFQAGCLGLVQAAGRFDPGRGLRFSTFAVPYILGEIKHLFRQGGAVSVGRTLQERALRASRTGDRLAVEWGRVPTVGELADALGLSVEDTAEALCAGRPPLSLDGGGDPDESDGWDLPVPAETDAADDRLALQSCLETLEPDDRALISLRYYDGLTQAMTAARLGMTQVQVCRLEKKLLLRLRQMMTA